jgi:hypothetical protein
VHEHRFTFENLSVSGHCFWKYESIGLCFRESFIYVGYTFLNYILCLHSFVTCINWTINGIQYWQCCKRFFPSQTWWQWLHLFPHTLTFMLIMRSIQIFSHLIISGWCQLFHIYKPFRTACAIHFTLQFYPVAVILFLFLCVSSITFR